MGCFITFEGPDGSGKTTQIQALRQALEADGYAVMLLREPGGTTIGDQIRTVLHDVQNVDMLPNAELLLYSASRAQLVGQVIRPALADGNVVLCDRYADSTLAYQGYGHGLDLELLRAVTTFATGGLRPDLVIYLDLDAAEGLCRKEQAFREGGCEWNRMDQKELTFHQRARSGYLKLAASEADRWLVVDAAQPVDVLKSTIRAHVRQLLSERADMASLGQDPSAWGGGAGP
jgi:dTMP kinase